MQDVTLLKVIMKAFSQAVTSEQRLFSCQYLEKNNSSKKEQPVQKPTRWTELRIFDEKKNLLYEVKR
jgi:hypothetical protein